MAGRMFGRVGLVLVVGLLAGWQAAPAVAGWRLASTSTARVTYNQGITFDQALGNFFFAGVTSTTNSAIYRTNSRLSLQASNTAVIPKTAQGYNHVGDLSFDPAGRRVLLPLECYYPNSGGNTCGSGAFGVVDPTNLKFLYYVRLWTGQIQKAMWDEISPDGRWIFTSSGTHLLAYDASKVNKETADNQLAGVWGGVGGIDLGELPTGDVSGAAFYGDPALGALRLFLALNRGTHFEVISYEIDSGPDGTPVRRSTPTTEITVAKSSSNNEPEGLAVTGASGGSYPLGGMLHWQMLPYIKLNSRILNYMPN
jgi:hypothetical protein